MIPEFSTILHIKRIRHCSLWDFQFWNKLKFVKLVKGKKWPPVWLYITYQQYYTIANNGMKLPLEPHVFLTLYQIDKFDLNFKMENWFKIIIFVASENELNWPKLRRQKNSKIINIFVVCISAS